MPFGAFTTSNVASTKLERFPPDYEKLDKFVGRFMSDLVENLGDPNGGNDTDFAKLVVRESFPDFNLKDENALNGVEGIISLNRDVNSPYDGGDQNYRHNPEKQWYVTYTFHIRLFPNKDANKTSPQKQRRTRLIDKISDYLINADNTYTDTVNGSTYSIDMNRTNELRERFETDETINTENFLTGVLVATLSIYQP